jgi:hypothetical protein
LLLDGGRDGLLGYCVDGGVGGGGEDGGGCCGLGAGIEERGRTEEGADVLCSERGGHGKGDCLERELVTDEGRVSGTVTGPMVDRAYKGIRHSIHTIDIGDDIRQRKEDRRAAPDEARERAKR